MASAWRSCRIHSSAQSLAHGPTHTLTLPSHIEITSPQRLSIMPTYRDIALSLQSQYDALTITEAPLKSAQSTSITGAAIVRRRKSEYFLIDDAQTYGGKTAFGTAPASKTANVMIPVYPSSQFWIVYACPAPQDGSSVRFYYFKLVISGKCIVSWGVGALDGWEGKTIFGLFNARSDFQGRKVVEKRGLFFPRVDKLDEEESDVGFEVRVYRSQARKREKAVVELEEAVTGSQGAIRCAFWSLWPWRDKHD